jgi:hypothetical protein
MTLDVFVALWRDEESLESHLENGSEPGIRVHLLCESRVAIGKTRAGRYLRVIYVPDPEPESIFVITAYELRGKPLFACRRRLRKKGKR